MGSAQRRLSRECGVDRGERHRPPHRLQERQNDYRGARHLYGCHDAPQAIECARLPRPRRRRLHLGALDEAAMTGRDVLYMLAALAAFWPLRALPRPARKARVVTGMRWP
jgi:hypothetical protein